MQRQSHIPSDSRSSADGTTRARRPCCRLLRLHQDPEQPAASDDDGALLSGRLHIAGLGRPWLDTDLVTDLGTDLVLDCSGRAVAPQLIELLRKVGPRRVVAAARLLVPPPRVDRSD